ncbi:expressed unknown protein [Seminavis robusta]|uniref:Uncharacterized protein n=1 Tax=Seminavis robusta TaxID=568900 RepID=A0A9N8DJ61_9STRA|nr:expressed unknown protein [Seminavis robusta]|eukprot:Sro89_g046790.1 n/a (159) ;mRNA; f:20484-21047
MGNSASSSSPSSTSRASEGFEVTLSDNFQQTVLQDFNAKVHAQYMQIKEQQQIHQQANSEQARQNELLQQQKQAAIQQLDKRLDALEADFDQKVKAADGAALTLTQKYVKPEEILGKEAPCADVRSSYASCQKSNPPGACAIYIQALQDCVTKAVAEK